MQLTANDKGVMEYAFVSSKSWYRKKLTVMILLSVCFQVSAIGYGQKVTLSHSNVSLEVVFKDITNQTGYLFFYTTDQMKAAKKVSIHVKNKELEEILLECFKEQPLTFRIINRTITIKTKQDSGGASTGMLSSERKGKVTNEKGEPVVGATVKVKGTNNVTITDTQGEFTLFNVNDTDVMVISGAEILIREIPVEARSFIAVHINHKVGELDQVVMMAYGETTRRLNTGNISKVTAEEISRQPVSNPLATLQGRVPGLVVTQTSGIQGAAFKVEIRGRTALDPSLSGNDPLFVIDGVPFERGNGSTNQLYSAANKPGESSGGLSPLNSINPMDIESIEVLKDADATAIYGSRGANGVVLITTRKGKAGKTAVSVNLSNGVSTATRTVNLLNTQQYVQLRKEAFANDGVIPSSNPSDPGYAPDFMVWDTTHYTDYKKMLLGGDAFNRKGQISLSGGNANTQFLISGGYQSMSNLLSNDLRDNIASAHFNINHSSTNKRFNLIFSGYYSNDNNKLTGFELSAYTRLAPVIQLYDPFGKIAWTQNGVDLANYGENPLARQWITYASVNENLQGNMKLNYSLSKQLTVNVNLGYNTFQSEEVSTNPKGSISPTSSMLPSANFANSQSKSWIIEPRIEYNKRIANGKLNVLMGGSWQESVRRRTSMSGTNYTSDLLLNSISAAGNITASNGYSQYRYTSFFARAGYNWKDKYLINLTGRRDGSSRFGPGKQFAGFGAVGLGWIFTNETLMKDMLSVLSFGKIRASYGRTGNDQIGEYKFLNLWSSTNPTYQGIPGLMPSSLFNPDYNWEVNKKLEAAVELGLLNNTILLSAAYYRNRSSSLLINDRLPNQTGFATIVRNYPALVQNDGIEISVSTKNIRTPNFQWTSGLNLTVPKNKLISFPSLSKNPTYSGRFMEGQSLSVIRAWKYLGVDPATGVYTIEDLNGDGAFTSADQQFLDNQDPRWYGGLQNTFSYKHFELTFLMEFRKQIGRNYLARISNDYPGLPFNQPVFVLDRWSRPGDVATVQKVTNNQSGEAAYGAYYLSGSDGIYSDASFIRLRNISLSYALPTKICQRLHVETFSLFINAQNLFVITDYLGSDPEIQDYYVTPTLKTIVGGIQINF